MLVVGAVGGVDALGDAGYRIQVDSRWSRRSRLASGELFVAVETAAGLFAPEVLYLCFQVGAGSA